MFSCTPDLICNIIKLSGEQKLQTLNKLLNIKYFYNILTKNKQEYFDIITTRKICKTKMKSLCTIFEYYFTLSMQTEYHDIDFDKTIIFLKHFIKLIENEELQENGLRFLCNQLWMSSRYFYEYTDDFINIFDNFLKLVKNKFTLSFIFKSLPYSWGKDETNKIINILLTKSKVNIDNDKWFMEMDEDIYISLNAFIELKDYIIIDLDNYYSQIYNGKCNNTINY